MLAASPCFTPGTLIATEYGQRPIEDLARGDRVVTRDNGLKRITWVGRRNVTYHEVQEAEGLQPVLVRAGAFGDGRPARDMVVSPNHRFLIGPGQGPLTLLSVGPTDQGGTAIIDGDQIIYEPAMNFAGTETFIYMVEDATGVQSSALVTIEVTNVNDDPTAVDNQYTVDEDSTLNRFGVLVNDFDDPDSGESLKVLALGPTSHSGHVERVNGNTKVAYTPVADFFGTETFTYTISDRNGGTDQATVTVMVVNRVECRGAARRFVQPPIGHGRVRQDGVGIGRQQRSRFQRFKMAARPRAADGRCGRAT